MEIWGYLSAFFVFFCGFFVSLKASRYFGVKQRYGVFLYIWHTLFCMVYLWYVTKNGGDALKYYRLAALGEFELKPGTHAVYMINSLFAYGLKFSLLGVFLLNNILGFLGLLACQGSLQWAVADKSTHLKRLAFLIILLPSLSFWSSAIGKDSISFMATGFALWASLRLEKRVLLMCCALFMMFLVRPHIAGIMVVALAFSIVLSTRISLVRRLWMGVTTLAISGVLIPFALQYAGVSESNSVEAIVGYIEDRQSANMEGGSSVDIASMSLPMKLFSYMFRPLLFEANSFFTLAAAIDNLMLLYLFLVGGYALAVKRVKGFFENRKFMWVYVALTWLVLAMTTANLGIAMRQKWMFAPFLIFLLLSLIGKNKPAYMLGEASDGFHRISRFK